MNTQLLEEIFLLGLMTKYQLDDIQIEKPTQFERIITTEPALPTQQALEVKNFFVNFWPAVYRIKINTTDGEL